jgi:hypothetical protein
MAFEPLPAQYENEHRFLFEFGSPSWAFVVFSGTVGGSLTLGGFEDERDRGRTRSYAP